MRKKSPAQEIFLRIGEQHSSSLWTPTTIGGVCCKSCTCLVKRCLGTFSPVNFPRNSSRCQRLNPRTFRRHQAEGHRAAGKQKKKSCPAAWLATMAEEEGYKAAAGSRSNNSTAAARGLVITTPPPPRRQAGDEKNVQVWVKKAVRQNSGFNVAAEYRVDVCQPSKAHRSYRWSDPVTGREGSEFRLLPP